MMKEKKKKENQREEAPQTRKHSFKQQLAGGVLCICLIAASMPLEYYGFPALVAQAEDELLENGTPDPSAEAVPDTVDGEEPGSTEEGQEPAEGEKPVAGENPEKSGENQTDITDGKDTENPEDAKKSEESGTDPAEPAASTENGITGEPVEDQSGEPGQEVPAVPGDQKTEASGEGNQGTTEEGTPVTPGEGTPAVSGEETLAPSGDGQPDIKVELPPEKSEEKNEDALNAILPQISNDGAPEAPGGSVSPDTTVSGDASYDVDFYSGRAGKKTTVGVFADTVFPNLDPWMVDDSGKVWEAVGWVTDSHGSTRIYYPGEPITYDAGKSSFYYGIYKKMITVSYKGIIGDTSEEDVQQPMYAIVHSNNVGYRYAEFKAKSISASSKSPEYSFLGWAVDADSAKASYTAGQTISTGKDLTLYAIYAKKVMVGFYSGLDGALTEAEAYVNVKNNQGVIASAPELTDIEGWKALGWTTGTAEYNTFRAPGTELAVSGETKYYGLYEKEITLSYIDTDPETPQSVTGSLRANVHGAITYHGAQFVLASLPDQAGYTFIGWNSSPDGTGTSYSGVCTSKEDIKLYPQWEDQTAPVLGEAVYGPGYQGLFHWIIGKKGLNISIPVTEEGSGVKSAEYTMYPENGASRSETIKIAEPEDAGTENIRLLRQFNGEKIQFTIDEDFKGYIIVNCTDNAGNSAQKRLTAEGGVIVEDNPPTIGVDHTSVQTSNGTAAIEVTVEDADGKNISGGLAGISYQVDSNRQMDLPGNIFTTSILESHKFTVEISGEGSHILQVSAIDNAGNETTRRVTVSLTRPPEEPDNGNNGDNGSGTGGNGNTGNGGGNTGSGDTGNGSGNTGTGGNGNTGTGGSGNTGTGGSGNTGTGGNGNTGTDGNGSGNTGNGSNASGSGNNGSGSGGSNNTGNSNTGSGSGNTGSGNSGSGNTGSGAPGTGDFPHMEIYATLGMIAGFSYLLLYFESGKNGMTEEKKDELVSRLIRWAAKGGFLHRALAMAAIFLLLTYYHSIGKCTDYRWRDTLQKVSRR